jgi:AraC-like DNA-binding protein
MAGIVRQAFSRAEGESDGAFYARMAEAASFLYACEPAVPAWGYDAQVETAFLTQGVVVQSQTAGRYTMVRDAARAASRGGDLIMISFTEAGRFGLAASAEGITQTVAAGGVIVLDLSHTFRLDVADHRHIVLLVSRATLLETWRDRALHGLVLPCDHPLAPAVVMMARALAELCKRGEPAHADALLDATLRLLGSVLAEISPTLTEPAAIGARLDGLIEAELNNPDLSSADLARQLGVSRATLYRLAQPLGGVARHLRARRIQRAWLMLTGEPGCDLAGAAALCGFSDAQSLRRTFRQLFGVSLEAALRLEGAERQAMQERIGEHLMTGWALRTRHATAVAK